MKPIYLLLALFAVALFLSCEQSDDLYNRGDDTQIENGIYEFRYQGVAYSAEYQKVGDDMIYKSKQVATLISNLSQNERIATFIHPDGTAEYFESPEELEVALFSDKSVIQTKAFEFKATSSAVLTIFEDSKCKGNSVSYTIDSNKYTIEAGTLGKMNDKISSIDLVCNWYVPEPKPYPDPYTHGNKCVATFFENADFQGYSIWFAVDPSYPHSYIHYFKSYALYPGSSKNWNDRVSSLKFAFYDN